MIDWARVAKPQPDGYDSDVLAALLLEKKKWQKAPNVTSGQSLLDGAIAIATDPFHHQSDAVKDTIATDEELANLDRHIKAWPDGARSMARLIDEFWPKRLVNPLTGEPRTGVAGSSSGHLALDDWNQTERFRMAVYVSVNDGEGGAGGTYHEFGHLRLETVGIFIEHHDGVLLANANPILTDGQIDLEKSELYPSPVRFDKPPTTADPLGVPAMRPMSAVVHGLYAWLIFSENDIRCAETINLAAGCNFLRQNIPKIATGMAEVRKNAKPTPAGEAFLEGLLAWGEDVVARGVAVVNSDRFHV